MADKANRTKFAFLGDPQCDRLSGDEDYKVWRGVLSRAAFELNDCGGQPLLVIAGDLVNHTRNEDEWEAFFRAGGDLFACASVITPTGNHDRSIAYDKKFDLPADGPAGLEKRFYTYDHGCIRFVVLDTNHLETSDQEKIAHIRAWLFDRLNGVEVPPVRIVVMHHPLFSLGSSLDDDIRAAVMQKNYLDVLEECGVSLVLCGHQHVYCRSSEISRKENCSDCGIVQIMGVSGGKHHSPRRTDFMQCIRQGISVATIIETDGAMLNLRTVSADGEVLDEWSKSVNHPQENVSIPFAVEAENIDSERRRGQKLGGISLKGQGFRKTSALTDDDIRKTDIREVRYSVYRRSGCSEKIFCGHALKELLEAAGWDGSGTGIKLTTNDGYGTTMKLDSLLCSWAFDDSGLRAYEVPALIIREEKSGCVSCSRAYICKKEKAQWSLVFGQQHPTDRVTRKWVHGLKDIEIVDLDELLGMYREESDEMTGNDGIFYKTVD